MPMNYNPMMGQQQMGMPPQQPGMPVQQGMMRPGMPGQQMPGMAPNGSAPEITSKAAMAKRMAPSGPLQPPPVQSLAPILKPEVLTFSLGAPAAPLSVANSKSAPTSAPGFPSTPGALPLPPVMSFAGPGQSPAPVFCKGGPMEKAPPPGFLSGLPSMPPVAPMGAFSLAGPPPVKAAFGDVLVSKGGPMANPQTVSKGAPTSDVSAPPSKGAPEPPWRRAAPGMELAGAPPNKGGPPPPPPKGMGALPDGFAAVSKASVNAS